MGHQQNAVSSLQLLFSVALPVLTYGIEALSIGKTQLIQLDHPWLRSCMKIFVTYDTSIIKQCQFFAGVLPMWHFYVLKCMSFWSKLDQSNNDLLHAIYTMCKNNDILPMAQKYGYSVESILLDYFTILTDRYKAECF